MSFRFFRYCNWRQALVISQRWLFWILKEFFYCAQNGVTEAFLGPKSTSLIFLQNFSLDFSEIVSDNTH